MSGTGYDVPVRIAGMDARIRTAFPGVVSFLQAYTVEAVPDSAPVIGFSPEEIASERQRLMQIGQSESANASDAGVEWILIHTALSEYAVSRDVLLMHGSALCMDGAAYLFTAPSGTGKSTHARLWREAFGNRCRMINDDKPFLICRENETLVCGSPWMGKHGLGQNISVPLKAVALIRQSPENHIQPVSPAEIFPALYPQMYRPRTAAGQVRALQLIRRVCRSAAFYQLDCNMDPEAAVIACEGMA